MTLSSGETPRTKKREAYWRNIILTSSVPSIIRKWGHCSVGADFSGENSEIADKMGFNLNQGWLKWL